MKRRHLQPATWLRPALALVLTLGVQVGTQLYAQTRNVVALDPAHGGPDTGATLDNGHTLEKDVTVALAARLRAALIAHDFTVVSTREADPQVLFDLDLRAGIVNHSRPSLCLVLHATSSGSGVHLYTSTLDPPVEISPPGAPLPWDSAQAGFLAQSHRLANRIGLTLIGKGLPTLLSSAPVRPLDNLTCPAVLLELAPLASPDVSPTSPSDAAYQQRVADAVAMALTVWRGTLPSPPTATHSSSGTTTGARP